MPRHNGANGNDEEAEDCFVAAPFDFAHGPEPVEGLLAMTVS